MPHQYQRSIFEIIVRDSIDLVVSDGEAIVSKVQYTYHDVCTIFEFFLPPPLVFLNLVLILKYTTVCLLGWTPLTPSPTHTLRTSYVFLPKAKKAVAASDFLSVMSVFCVIRHLAAVKSRVDRTLEGCEPAVRSKYNAMTANFYAAGSMALERFVEGIR